MTARREDSLTVPTEAALAELRKLIREAYPDAHFAVRRGVDEPESFESVATIDIENRDDLLDLIIDRVMAFQIEDGIPIHVIPLRPSTSQREIAARAAAATAAAR